MGRYILRRLLAMGPVLLVVSVVVFSLIHLTPGDPVAVMLGEQADPAAIDKLRHELGLDLPLHIQYLRWLGQVLRGDLGHSIWGGKPVSQLLLQRLPVTLELAVTSMLVSLLIALPVGIISAVWRNSKADMASTLFALFGVAVPNFWLGLMLILLLSLTLRWLQPSGYISPFQDPLASLRLMIMPSITLGTAMAAVVTRMLRSGLIEVLEEEYILTARSKGLLERVVILRHALKNALIPVVTVIGLQIGHLLGGAVITETIFILPGVGRLIAEALFQRDFPIVQGVVLFMAAAFVFTNLVVDILYAYLDPRIRYE